MNPVILYLFPFLFFLAVTVSLIQDRFTKAIFDKYQEIWMTLGAPGGWFWRPSGRIWLSNLMITRRFWVENQLGLEKSTSLPEEIVRHYRIYYAVSISLWVAFILLGLLAFGVHVYNLGQAGSVNPSSVP